MFELMKKFMLKRFLKKYAEDDDEFGKIFGKNVRTVFYKTFILFPSPYVYIYIYIHIYTHTHTHKK